MKPRALCGLITLLLGLIPASAAELTVYAAASLTDALKELTPLYAKTSGHTLRFNFGASGVLARQIKEGAPADILVSADALRLNQLDEAGLLLPGTRRILLANTLVVVVGADAPPLPSLDALTQPATRRIALGIPATVPAGTYASEYLRKIKLWDTLQPKFVQLDNVRAVLAAVETGNADAGFVYKTDALASSKVTIGLEIPRSEGPVITYPIAVINSTAAADTARHFVEWLAASEAQAVFVRHGFLSVP